MFMFALVFLAGFYLCNGMDNSCAFEIADFGERSQPPTLFHTAQKAFLIHLLQNKTVSAVQQKEIIESLPHDIKTPLIEHALGSHGGKYWMPEWLKLVKTNDEILIGKKLFGLREGFQVLSAEDELKQIYSWYLYWLENPGFEGLFKEKTYFFEQDEDGRPSYPQQVGTEARLLPPSLYLAAAYKRYKSFSFLLDRYKFVLSELLLHDKCSGESLFRKHFEELIKDHCLFTSHARSLLRDDSLALPFISKIPFLVFFRDDKSICHTRLKNFFQKFADAISDQKLSDLVRHARNSLSRKKNGRKRKKGVYNPEYKYHVSAFKDVKIIDELKMGSTFRFERLIQSITKGQAYPSDLLIRYLASQGNAINLKRVIIAQMNARQDGSKCIPRSAVVDVAFTYVKNRPFWQDVAAFLIENGASSEEIHLNGMRYGCSVFQKKALEDPHFLEYAIKEGIKQKRALSCVQFLIDHIRKFELNFQEPDFLNNLLLLNQVVKHDDTYNQEVLALLLRNNIQPMQDRHNKYPFELASSERMRRALIQNNGIAVDDAYFRGWLFDQVSDQDVRAIRSIIELLTKEQLSAQGIFAECRRELLVQGLKLKQGEKIIQDLYYKCGDAPVMYNGQSLNWLLFALKLQSVMNAPLHHINRLILLGGRDLHATDENGKTALQLAEDANRQDIVEVLKARVASAKSTDALHS